ncbi:hypothetical protein Fmac_028868 [Flemingia macrophylla]|uniref:Uncharacterized protein n=1 Tax=Flemingia macrophylla TaxID=520843 RepID=A0ABD1L8R0_9FABA
MPVHYTVTTPHRLVRRKNNTHFHTMNNYSSLLLKDFHKIFEGLAGNSNCQVEKEQLHIHDDFKSCDFNVKFKDLIEFMKKPEIQAQHSCTDFQSQKVRIPVLESHKNPSETAHLQKSLTTPLGNHNPIQELLPKDNHSPLESKSVQTNNKDQFRIHLDLTQRRTKALDTKMMETTTKDDDDDGNHQRNLLWAACEMGQQRCKENNLGRLTLLKGKGLSKVMMMARPVPNTEGVGSCSGRCDIGAWIFNLDLLSHIFKSSMTDFDHCLGMFLLFCIWKVVIWGNCINMVLEQDASGEDALKGWLVAAYAAQENSQEDIGRNQEGVSPHQFFNPGELSRRYREESKGVSPHQFFNLGKGGVRTSLWEWVCMPGRRVVPRPHRKS